MKQIIITIILLSSLRLMAQTFQGERTFYEMPSRSAKFTTNIPAGKVIFQADSARFIRLTKYVNAGWKLDTVYKLKRYMEVYIKPDTGDNKPFPWVNVKDYGAIGDDTTDNTTAFNNAVDQAYTVKGILYIPEGTYRVNNVSMKSIIVTGEGNGSVIKLLSDASNAKIFSISNTSNVSISNVHFKGYNTMSGVDSSGVSNIGQSAVYINGNCEDIIVTNCLIEGIKGYGIHATGWDNQLGNSYIGNKFSNNTIVRNYGGIYLGERSEYNLISNTFIVDNVIGADNRGGNNKFTGVSIKTNWYGIYIGDGFNDGHGGLVSCDFNHCGKYGIYIVDQTNGFVISGNNIFISNVCVKSSRGINFTGNNFGAGTIFTFIDASCSFTGNYLNDDTPATIVLGGANDITAWNNVYQLGYWNLGKREKRNIANGYNLFAKNDFSVSAANSLTPSAVLDARTNAGSEVMMIGGGVPVASWGWGQSPNTSYLKSKLNGYNIGLRGYSSSSNDLDVTSAGDVGIGTSSPSTKLHVNGVITATGGTSTDWNSKVSSVSGTSPISSSGGTTPSISISQAGSSTAGYLSSSDWTYFNNKQSKSDTNSFDATRHYVDSALSASGGSQWTIQPPGIAYDDTANVHALQTDNIVSEGSSIYVASNTLGNDNAGTLYVADEFNEYIHGSGGTSSTIQQAGQQITLSSAGKRNGSSFIFDSTGFYTTNHYNTIGKGSYPFKSFIDSIYGGSADNSGIQFFTSSTTNYPTGRFDFNVADQGAYNKVLSIVGRSVGINNSTPNSNWDLDVNGTSKLSSIVGGDQATSNVIIKSTTGAASSTGIAFQVRGGTNGATVAMTILNNGYVGFGGKTDPAYPIDVTGTIRGSSSIIGNGGTNTWASNYLYGTTAGVFAIRNISGNAASALSLGSKDIEAMRIDPSQRVGIGTTAPATKLHIKDGAIRAGVTVRADIDSTIYKLTATGKGVVISTDSAIRLHGTATVWEDLMMPFTTGENATVGYPTFNADSLWYNFVIDTSGITKCIIYMPVQMPHRWKEGSTVYPHIHYHHVTAQGTPTFKVKYKWVNTGSLTGDWKWLTMETTSGTTNNTHQMCYSTSGISGSGKTISSILLCMIYLTAQTGTGGIDAYQFDIHHEINSLGSNTETSKN